MLPDDLKKSAEAILTSKLGSTVHIADAIAAAGGCINESYILHTNKGNYFIKYNPASSFPGMFEKECFGLQLMANTHTLAIPEVIATAQTGKYGYLLLEYIESGIESRHFWNEFGIKLADLHRHTADYFGLEQDNYIASLVQSNKADPDFFSFFISQRIEPQLKIARNKGAFNSSEIRYFDSLFNTLHNIIPAEKPALIHGDLWNGNFMVASDGSPCLFDPAVYFGHREADIAMTRLFGGFQPEFYHAYNQAFPMENDWQKRMDIYNLYPLLVHVNLFGGGYSGQVLQIIRQF
jgi:fructosamine-3-kinase